MAKELITAEPDEEGVFVTFPNLQVKNENLTVCVYVQWADDEPLITEVRIDEGIDSARMNALPWRYIRKEAYKYASILWLDDRLDTGEGRAEVIARLRDLRPESEEFLAAAAALCRWCDRAGWSYTEAIAAATGKSEPMANVYIKRIRDTYAATKNPAYKIKEAKK